MMCQTLGHVRKEASTLFPRNIFFYSDRNTHDVSDEWSRAQETNFKQSDVSDDVSRTRGTPIALSFHKPAFLQSGRGREQSSNSHNVSDDV